MPRQVFSQNGFNAGRLSPLLEGRQDIAQYDRGLSEARNCLVTPRGPVNRRAATEFIAEAKDSTSNIALIPFQFSEDDSFMLEFGDQYIRFYTNSAQVESAPSVPLEVATNYLSAEVEQIAFTQFGDIIYLAHPNHAPATLTRVTNTNWVLEDITFTPEPTFEDGYTPSGITVTPGATTGLGITFTASASVFLKADEGRQIINLNGAGRASIVTVSSGTSAICDIIEDFPNTNPVAAGDWKMDLSPIAELTPSGLRAGSVITIEADVIGTTTDVATFRSDDVGRYLLLNGGVTKIIELVDSHTVRTEVLKSLNTTDETQLWSLEDPTWSASRGYPAAVTLFQQRLVFGGTTSQPQTVWMSETGIFNGFGIGPDDEDSIEVDLSSSQVNNINWFAVTRDLVVGTVGGESTLAGAGTGGAITPATVSQTPRTYHGSTRQRPVVIAGEALFIQRSARKVRSLQYDFNIDGYIGRDLTFLAEDITEGSAKQMAYAENPDSIIYVVDEAGDLLTCAYDRSEQVTGWSFWDTDGSFKWVQSITSGSVDQVWVVVEREVDGNTKRYIELVYSGAQDNNLSGYADSFLTLDNPITISGITQANPAVVTATAHGLSNGDKIKMFEVGGMTEVIGKTYVVANATANTFELTNIKGNNIDSTGFTAYTSGGKAYKLVSTISGLDHLEGKTVKVKADGASHPDKVVSSGSITLDRDSYQVLVGLAYTTEIETLTPEYDSGIGSIQGQQQKRAIPILRVFKSAVPTVNGAFKPSRNSLNNMDQSVPLTTGTLRYSLQAWDTEGKLKIETDEPLPLTLLAIYGTVDGNAR